MDCRFVLLDFGHPMTDNSISNVIKSLENILALKLALTRSKTQTFGISILNSDFAIFEPEINLRKNYDFFTKNLHLSLKSSKLNNRVTVQEYKYLLSKSMEGFLREFHKFRKTNCCQSAETSVAIITKKTASVLADILMDVTNKLQRNIPSMPLIKKYKIIQVSNEQEKICMVSDKDTAIDWISCSDNVYNLSCFFKEWFLHKQHEIRIQLSKELEIKCDIDDCMVDPVLRTFDLFKDTQYKSLDNTSLGTKPTSVLKITARLPVSNFCPKFGIQRRIYPTHSCNLKWTESQFNSKIFKNLCQRLHQTGQGLLAETVSLTETGTLTKYHFLTSDGNILLMNDVAPEELHLPGRVKLSVDSNDDETAAALVTACFEKIKVVNDYVPKDFPSGVYDCLRKYLSRPMKKTEKNPQPVNDCTENRKKRQKLGSEMEMERVHPALLSPNVVEKYRKIHSQAFNLPELSTDYNEC